MPYASPATPSSKPKAAMGSKLGFFPARRAAAPGSYAVPRAEPVVEANRRLNPSPRWSSQPRAPEVKLAVHGSPVAGLVVSAILYVPPPDPGSADPAATPASRQY